MPMWAAPEFAIDMAPLAVAIIVPATFVTKGWLPVAAMLPLLATRFNVVAVIAAEPEILPPEITTLLALMAPVMLTLPATKLMLEDAVPVIMPAFNDEPVETVNASLLTDIVLEFVKLAPAPPRN